MAESAAKDRELNQVQDMYERSLQTLEDDLRATRDEADNLKQECVYVDNECASLQFKMLNRKLFLLYPHWAIIEVSVIQYGRWKVKAE